MDNDGKAQAAAERIIKLEEELEAGGVAEHGKDALAITRAALHQWIDSVAATVVSPALGRVTLIHADGRESTIVSPELPFLLSRPVGPAPAKG